MADRLKAVTARLIVFPVVPVPAAKSIDAADNFLALASLTISFSQAVADPAFECVSGVTVAGT